MKRLFLMALVVVHVACKSSAPKSDVNESIEATEGQEIRGANGTAYISVCQGEPESWTRLNDGMLVRGNEVREFDATCDSPLYRSYNGYSVENPASRVRVKDSDSCRAGLSTPDAPFYVSALSRFGLEISVRNASTSQGQQPVWKPYVCVDKMASAANVTQAFSLGQKVMVIPQCSEADPNAVYAVQQILESGKVTLKAITAHASAQVVTTDAACVESQASIGASLSLGSKLSLEQCLPETSGKIYTVSFLTATRFRAQYLDAASGQVDVRVLPLSCAGL